MVELVNKFAIERNIKIEDISNLSLLNYNNRTLEAITEDVILYFSTRDGNKEIVKLMKDINMIADDGEYKIIVYYKDDYYYDSLDEFKIFNFTKWFDNLKFEINNYMCEMCYKEFLKDIITMEDIKKTDNQSINCTECNYKYCSECIMKYVIEDNKCYNCKKEWCGKLTLVYI